MQDGILPIQFIGLYWILPILLRFVTKAMNNKVVKINIKIYSSNTS